MNAEILSIGQELLLGETTDTNAAYLSTRLAALGISVHYHTCVGDNICDIIDVLKIAVNRSELILCTGGLGPTADDVTREAISEFCNVPLVVDEESLHKIEEIFLFRNIEMPINNRAQAMIPEGAGLIRNEQGTATGFCLPYNEIQIISLPGVPSEMKRMFDTFVYPRLQDYTLNKSVIITKLLNCFGTPESAVDEKIRHLMGRGWNPSVGTKVHNGIISVRILAHSATMNDANSLVSMTEDEIRGLLGDYIFGEGADGLEQVVAKQLEQLNMTLVTAESCTGGLIAHKLTNVSGISKHFLEGIVSYSNDAKVKILNVPQEMLDEHGAVSEPVAQAMAKGVQALCAANLAIAVTGIAGPTGGTADKPVGLVYISVADSDNVLTQKFQFFGSREDIKERSANTALNMLRLYMMDIAKSKR